MDIGFMIRKYEPDDVGAMAAIWNEVVEEGGAFPQEECLTLETGEAFFAGQSYCGVAVELGTGKGSILGLYILHPNNVGRCGHICNASYAVKAKYRGETIGEQLVRDSMDQAKGLGFRILQFNAVVASNAPARHLYEKIGFRQLGVIPGGFRLQDGRYEDIFPYCIALGEMESRERIMDFEEVQGIVKKAGILFRHREEAARVTVKGAADYVTEVDKKVQNFIQKALEERYPEIQFLGEEKNNDNIDLSGRVWVLDPVDGTTNLIHDYRRSTISLALVEDGRIAAGIVYQPYTHEMFFAERGKGAFLNGSPIHVSGAQTMEESLIAVGTNPYDKETLGEISFRNIYSVFMDSQDIRRSGSAALDLAEVAAGRTDGFFERKLNIWDYAAGAILIEEAGGHVTDYEGKELSCAMKSSVVCGAPAIHRLLIDKYLGGF